MSQKATRGDDAYAKALNIIEFSRTNEQSTLDLSGLGLTALPPEIGQLTGLSNLDLDNNQLTALPAEIGQLTSLTSLSLERNKLTVLPPKIGQLTALRFLYLSGNQLTALPPEIGQLTALVELRLTQNKLTALPPEIGQLTALVTLDIGFNQLSALLPEFRQLRRLMRLSLTRNRFENVPPQIMQLSTLQVLSLAGNEIRALQPEIGQLIGLTNLGLGQNRLTALPSTIEHVTNLEVLNLDGNQFTAIPPEVYKFKHLTRLDVDGNNFKAIEPAIGQLTELTILFLRHNQLETLPPEIGQLRKLQVLHLSGNRLATLPRQLLQLTALERLYLHHNSELGIPPEVLGPSWEDEVEKHAQPRSPKEILDSYFTHRKAAREGTQPLMEAKLLVLGEASVGKSCLIAALSEGKRRHELDGKGTSGIVRKLWTVKVKNGTLAPKPKTRGSETLRLNCWDFGGQEIYHSAHTLFLTRRAIYVIVISKRDNERQNNVDYWLRMATSFGGPDAIIYVVVNKDDEKVGYPPDENALVRKYPQIRGFLRTSCDDLSGIAEARETIVRAALLLEGMRLPVAKSWLAIKNKLETMKEHTLSVQQFAELCGVKIGSTEAQRELLHLCDRLGTVRYFPSNSADGNKLDAPELCQTAILNPEWVTLGIYALFDDNALAERGGLLSRAEMAATLKKRGYPVEHERIIEEVMRRFDLLYDSTEHGSEHRMLIPLMLPELEPKLDWPKDTLEFVYQYEVMPAGLVPAFIARSHKDISKTVSAWRHGCVLEVRGCQVRIIGDSEQKRVQISVLGTESLRRDGLDQVRFTFDALHGVVENLPVQELIPVPGHRDAPMLDYDFVRSLDWKGVAIFETKGAKFGETILVNVREALDGVRGLAKKERDAQQRKTVYVLPGGKYTEMEDNAMNDDHSINISGDNYGQVGQTLTNCTNMIQQQAPGERKVLLEALNRDVAKLIESLPEVKKDEAPQIAENLELMVKQATSAKPNRKWYSVSAEGLLEAAKWVKDFTGNIAGTIGNLGKAIWPDFQLPASK